MKTRDSMIFYRSFYEAIRELPERNQVEVLRAICEFGFDGSEPEISGLSKTIWILIKPNLQANRKKWESGCKAKTKQPKSKTEAKNKQTRSKVEANVYVDVDVDVDEDGNEDKDKDKNEKGLMVVPSELPNKKFLKPSLQEVSLYVQSKEPQANKELIHQFAEKFWNFYESNGWKVGKNPMKSWQSAIRTWNETLQKTINPFKESSAKESFPFSPQKKGSWDSRQSEYLRGIESIINDTELK
jgi:hypothetical protein